VSGSLDALHDPSHNGVSGFDMSTETLVLS
jgi:hypothetical protein